VYNGRDLLKMIVKDPRQYDRDLLKILFTPKELVNSLIPPGQKQNKPPPLPQDRLDILHEAIRAKYRIAKLKYDNFYTLYIRLSLVQF
ncbi:unnamed protein product, partial [Didymodactylos carnosus]